MGRLRARERRGPGFRVAIETDLAPLELGESIAVNGVCLTVVTIEPWGFNADVSLETVERTTVGRTAVGAGVNLERSLRIGDRIGGHLVSGHVDGLARVTERAPSGEAIRVRFAAPASLMGFLAEKGSVCLDGVSLTVNGVFSDGFEVMLVPHTLSVTSLQTLAPGRELNIEVDLIARYVSRCLETGTGGGGGSLLDALGSVPR
jgi:riboflavin synthase